MPEEVKRKRGRPPKNKTDTNYESESHNPSTFESTNEFNSYYSPQFVSEAIFSCGVYDYFSKEEIDAVLRNPIANHDTAIKLSEFVYGKSGIIGNSIDYCTSIMTLDRIITSKSKSKRVEHNKELMSSTLKRINDKAFIRDGLFTNMLDGIAFYYFEVTQKKSDKSKFMTDYDVENIFEINELGLNASIITLPWEYTKIVGKKNGRYVLAFNLQYFSNYNGESLNRKLRKYPKEIVDGYNDQSRKGNWIVLDNDKTMCVKIKCKDNEAWGRSLIIAALSDVLYKDYFTETKRGVLDEICNKVVYEVFPENKQGNGSSLNKTQQENQHNTVKKAIMNKNSRGGVSFMSLAAGTKLDTVDTSTDIFDVKNEANLNNDIAVDLGISASLIGAMSTGNYAAGSQNLEMITSQLYTWICLWKNELVHVINKNIIKDEKNEVDIYYFPTSFVNRKEFFEMMSTLYTQASGSLTFLIASSGIDPEIYLSVLDSEIEKGYFKKYLPHLTSNTISKDDNVGGRPTGDCPEENIGGNSLPSPSDKT
ncbi:hypothetical protein FYJ38_12660 [Clostridium sp. WB02_MRS01]|uniref:hypothetical protein n=1 Tax=Clostridium sp. WB02_MRS01 TaxID=2605777 RepID=UPI0012B43B7A|nr:hypothetical protein [Clostridium sp. WB02_MRS01]MSS09490.1 hypothetical protein [Clostridium sp. WB02_MRS01]